MKLTQTVHFKKKNKEEKKGKVKIDTDFYEAENSLELNNLVTSRNLWYIIILSHNHPNGKHVKKSLSRLSWWTLALFLLMQRKLLVWLPYHDENCPILCMSLFGMSALPTFPATFSVLESQNLLEPCKKHAFQHERLDTTASSVFEPEWQYELLLGLNICH